MMRFALETWVAILCAMCSAALSAQGTPPQGGGESPHPIGSIIGHAVIAGNTPSDSTHLHQIQQYPVPRLHPNVVDLPFDSAASLLRSRIDVRVFRRDSDTFDGRNGHVARQYPAANTPRQAGEIADTVIVRHLMARAPQRVPVPRVVGRSLTSAIAILQGASLVASVSVLTPADSTRAIVEEQQPTPPDSALLGSSIRLVVTVARKVSVPRVVGLDPMHAYPVLAALSLRGSVQPDRRVSSILRGKVAEQYPSQNMEVDSGSTVNLWLSAGSQLISVPMIIGLTKEDGRDTLATLGLVLAERASEKKAATGSLIRTQTPRSGTRKPRGASIYVTYEPAKTGSYTYPILIGAIVFILAALFAYCSGVLHPTFRANIESEDLSLEFSDNSPVIQHELSFAVHVQERSADLIPLSANFILKDVPVV